MKKTAIILQLFFATILLASCSTSKEARSYKKTIDGSWQLKTVVTEGIMGKIKAEIFNEADFNCFIGSTWKFNSNNNLGSYTISKNEDACTGIKRDIRWSIYEPSGEDKQLQFKRLDTKLKEIDGSATGFRFKIIQMDANTMQLRSDFTFENKPASFVYNFVRI
ncbi:MAG: lipocalin family protein [Ferruginibacter sp.]